MVTQVVTYISATTMPLLLLFIPYKFLVRMVIKFRKKKKKGGHFYTAATKRLSCFLSMKGCVKRSDVAYFRVQKYADKGAFLLH